MTRRKKGGPPAPRHNHRRGSPAPGGHRRSGRLRRVLLGTAKLTGLTLFCGVMVWGGGVLWKFSGPWLADTFRIRDVAVSGLHHLTRAEVLRKLNLGKHATLYGLETAPLIERLKAMPWVKDVELTRVPWHGLEVAIVERRPAGVIRGVHANVLVDEDGVILKWIGQTTDDALPLVTGIDIKLMAQTDSRERRMVKEAFELAALIGHVDGQRVQVDGSHPMNLVVSVNETRVSFGRAPFHEKWMLFRQLTPVLVAEHGASLVQRHVDVDLRFVDRVIVRERG